MEKSYLKETPTDSLETVDECYTDQESNINKLQHDQPPEKTKSLASSSSSKQKSVSSSVLSRKRAKAEAAKAKVEYTKKESDLQKRHAALQLAQAKTDLEKKELEADLAFLKAQKEAAIAVAEVNALEASGSDAQSQVLPQELFLPQENPVDRITKYVHDHASLDNYKESTPYQQRTTVPEEQTIHAINNESIHIKPKPSDNPHNPAPVNQPHLYNPNTPIFTPTTHSNVLPQPFPPSPTSDFTRYLLKRDLMSSRLTNFTDRPESYSLWKSSFKGIMQELQTSPQEEMDFLIKWLGPESSRYARNLCAASINNPFVGLQRIWSRLDEKYGSPEIIEATLKSKLENFPKLGNRDFKQLYDLSDILTEIEALKEDPNYSILLGYFDSSSGVIPIVRKLPYSIQEKWTARATDFKRRFNVAFPPFWFFSQFVRDMSQIKNDPSFHYDLPPSTPQTKSRSTPTQSHYKAISSKKTDIDSQTSTPRLNQRQQVLCPLHKCNHQLNDCRGFKSKPIQERKSLLKLWGICFRCLSGNHLASDCQEAVKCKVCKSDQHSTGLHSNNYISSCNDTGTKTYSGEKVDKGSEAPSVNTKCTNVCGNQFKGKSCAKTVLVQVSSKENPATVKKMYAVLDDQSNCTLANSNFFDYFNVNSEGIPYLLSSCSGNTETVGRRAEGFIIKDFSGHNQFDLPTITECNQIPNNRHEIPTPAVAKSHSHLNSIANCIPEIDDGAEIMILIGRDLPDIHHVVDQLTGPRNSPYAQRLPLGWVIVGESCLGEMHKSDTVNVYKTSLLMNGRPSIFTPCPNKFNLDQVEFEPSDCFPLENRDQLDYIGATVFNLNKDDETIGMSVDDKKFLKLMEGEFKKDSSGKWVAPLPFRPERPRLPDNLQLAVKRSISLDRNLKKDPDKMSQFITFMQGIFDKRHAEIAPPLQEKQERWYLPIFGVRHPQKPDQIRGVFDSSAVFQGISLNNVLLTGPDLTNSLLGILLRFRKEQVAVMADIQQMFYCFSVREDHRDFLRFIWYRDNDPNNELIEYRMCVHVFGNSPSPAVATYGLRLTAQLGEEEYGQDVSKYVNENFYVDDGLISLPTSDQAIDLMKRTQAALWHCGQIRLHKIVSNKAEVLKAFLEEDRATDFKDLDLTSDVLPSKRTLGVIWDLGTDSFTFKVSKEQKPFTKRGVLSTINSLYDPLGFIAPIIIQGKTFLRNIMNEVSEWDEPLPEEHLQSWSIWRESLQTLENLQTPRTYASSRMDNIARKEIHIFSDASLQAIASVAYLVTIDLDGKQEIGFIMGKTKVAPTHGHTIPRLELCAAVMAVEIYETITEQLDIAPDSTKFYTDSRVVLGYIYNESRRFHVYVGNRIDRVRKSSSPNQWTYVSTENNPADQGTRGLIPSEMANSSWLTGPTFLFKRLTQEDTSFPLIDSETDKELKLQVSTCKTTHSSILGSMRFERFSKWTNLVKGVALLKHIASHWKNSVGCQGWHHCQDWRTVESYKAAEVYVLQQIQQESFPQEIEAILKNDPIPKNSPLISLDPRISSDGLLRVGGRLNFSNFGEEIKNPIIIPKHHHVGTLLVRHIHEQGKHQGRHLTEGAVRAAGFWIIGGKRLVSSVLHNCIPCRKVRAPHHDQKMSDLPCDRLQPSPPFTFVGVDTFGPWQVVARRTRGGQAVSKRWAILFTCLNTRAIHIEVVDDLGSSAFINALKRFTAIRGEVKEYRSDRGTNFIGAIDNLKIDAINVETGDIKHFLYNSGVIWKFNPPHSSHMGGVWERLIGITKRILNSILRDVAPKNLTHDVLCTLMAEVSSIVNARPIAPVSTDPQDPSILSPSAILTMKTSQTSQPLGEWQTADLYRAQWKRVQALADAFWSKWRREYLHTLQPRRKWTEDKPNIKAGDLILLKDKDAPRNSWPMAIVTKPLPGEDGRVRKAVVRVAQNGNVKEYTRPITEMVILCSK